VPTAITPDAQSGSAASSASGGTRQRANGREPGNPARRERAHGQVDRFEQRDGQWLIAKRVCAFDWVYRVPFTWDQRSWFAEDFTLGRRDRTDISYRGA
jgi:hypothetical protein